MTSPRHTTNVYPAAWMSSNDGRLNVRERASALGFRVITRTEAPEVVAAREEMIAHEVAALSLRLLALDLGGIAQVGDLVTRLGA